MSSARSVSASDPVSISYSEASLRALADRLASELTSDGYVVEFGASSKSSPCEQPALGGATTSTPDEAAWVHLSADPNRADSVVASICFRSTVALLQRVSSRALRSEPDRFALATAEAMNGLRAQVPLLSSRPTVQAADPRVSAPAPNAGPPSERAKNVLALTQTALFDLADFPVIFGASLTAKLAATPVFHLVLDAFLPTSAAELANDEARVQTRVAWFRVGLSGRVLSGPAHLNCSLLSGPALTWATAEARSPRLGAADVKLGALLTLGATLEYPSDSIVFALGTARIASLLPAVRVAVGSDSSDALGPVLTEASLGIGLRFGAGSD